MRDKGASKGGRHSWLEAPVGGDCHRVVGGGGGWEGPAGGSATATTAPAPGGTNLVVHCLGPVEGTGHA